MSKKSVTAPVTENVSPSDTLPLPPSELDALPETLPHLPEPPQEEPVNLFEDGEYKVTSRDGLLEMISKAHAEPKEYVPPPRSAGQLARLAEEQAAGRRALGLHETRKIAEKLPPADDQGSMIPVHRPGDFREYQPMAAPARDKKIG